MARKSNSGGWAVIILLAAGSLILLSALIAPVVVLVMLVRAELKSSSIKGVKNISDLDATEPELSEINENKMRIASAEEYVNELLAEAEAAGLSKRQDGYFDERSSLGKEINPKLEQAAAKGRSFEGIISRIEFDVIRRKRNWLNIKSSLSGSRWMFATYLIAFAVVINIKAEWMISIDDFARKFSVFPDSLVSDQNIYSTSIMSLLISATIYYVMKHRASSKLSKVRQ